MTRPIKCFYFDHAYDQAAPGPCCYLSIDGATNFKDLHQHPKYIEIKQNFEQGKWTDSYCDKCKNLEQINDSTNISKRQSGLHLYTTYQVTNNDVDKLYQLTVDTGRYCNIQCRSCNPYSSSSWIPEWLYMSQHNITNLNNWREYSLIKNKKTWPTTYYDQSDDFSNVKTVSLLGGEPLYNQDTLVNILQKILDSAGPACLITINTNATISYSAIKILKEFKRIVLILSIDAVGKAAEFIRTGCNWENVNTNILEYKKSLNIDLLYHPAYSILNLFEFVKLRDWFTDLNIPETSETTVVTTPAYLNYSILNDTEKVKVLKYLKENNLNFIYELIKNSVYNENDRKIFFNFMEHTKSYHQLDWREYLPELYALMGDS